MKTVVLMERQILGGIVKQNSQTGFFCITDLLKIGSKYRALNDMDQFNYDSWYNSSSTKEFLTELKSQVGEVIVSKKGKTGERWGHPFVFIDLALQIDPKLKIEVYAWIMDELLKYRNNSGDSYKLMCGALYDNCANKSKFHRGVSMTAMLIQKECGVSDWQKASEKQLSLRDKIHENIALLCDVLRDNNQAIRIGIQKAKESFCKAN
jgi:hypothetical protein